MKEPFAKSLLLGDASTFVHPVSRRNKVASIIEQIASNATRDLYRERTVGRDVIVTILENHLSETIEHGLALRCEVNKCDETTKKLLAEADAVLLQRNEQIKELVTQLDGQNATRTIRQSVVQEIIRLLESILKEVDPGDGPLIIHESELKEFRGLLRALDSNPPAETTQEPEPVETC